MIKRFKIIWKILLGEQVIVKFVTANIELSIISDRETLTKIRYVKDEFTIGEIAKGCLQWENFLIENYDYTRDTVGNSQL